MSENPDAVVALTANIIGRSKPRNSLRCVKPDRQHGIHPVMDAIACICISEPRSSVVAVALKLSLPVVRFIVAANDRTNAPGIVSHLETVWNLMKSISDLTFLSLNTEAVDDDMKVDTPDRESNSIANLYASIYSYSRAAVLKRFNKHEARLLSLLDIANASAELSHDLSVGIDGKSFSVRRCLDTVIKATSLIRGLFARLEGGFDSTSKQDLFNYTTFQHKVGKALLEDSSPSSPFANWIMRLQGCK